MYLLYEIRNSGAYYCSQIKRGDSIYEDNYVNTLSYDSERKYDFDIRSKLRDVDREDVKRNEVRQYFKSNYSDDVKKANMQIKNTRFYV